MSYDILKNFYSDTDIQPPFYFLSKWPGRHLAAPGNRFRVPLMILYLIKQNLSKGLWAAAPGAGIHTTQLPMAGAGKAKPLTMEN